MSEKMMDVERAAFEAWYAEYACVTAERVKTWRSGDGYRAEYAGAFSAWDGWQARASQPVGVPEVSELQRLLDDVRDVRSADDVAFGWHEAIERMCAQTVKAEQVQCDTCHGQGEICVGQQTFGYMSMQPPEPIMEACPECGGEEAPSLPAAGLAVDRVVATAPERIYLIIGDDCPRDADFSELGEVAWCEEEAEQGIEYVRAALSAQQSAPERVSVPRELIVQILRDVPETNLCAKALRALLSGAREGGV